MKTLFVVIAAASAALSSTAHAKSCSIERMRLSDGIVTESKTVSLIYNPINQENGGDTFFMSGDISPQLMIQRDSYLEDGDPTISIVEKGTNKILATSDPKTSSTPSRTLVDVEYHAYLYTAFCD